MRRLLVFALLAALGLVVWLGAVWAIVLGQPAPSLALAAVDEGLSPSGAALRLSQTRVPSSSLVVEPDSLWAQVPVGGKDPQELRIGNEGISATLNYTIAAVPAAQMAGIVAWLDITPTHGAVLPGGQASVAVTFIPQEYMLAGELHLANLIVYSDSATEPVSITVQAILEVVAAPLTVAPSALSVELSGGGTAWRNLALWNQSTVTLAFTVTVPPAGLPPADLSWLGVSPLTGTLKAGARGLVTVTFASAGLSTGSYAADLVVENDSPTGFPITVPVDLLVRPYKRYLPLVFSTYTP